MLKMKKKISLRTKLILKGLFHSIIQFCVIFAFAWYKECIFEMAVIYCCFFIFRSQFEKQYHATTTWLCTLYTFIVFFIVSNITPKKELSLLLIICFTFIINFISFLVRDYFDLKDKFKAMKVKISKGIDKNKLLDICKVNNLNNIETSILVYYYCDRLSLTAISFKLHYSYDYIAELKSKAIKKIKTF